MRGSFSPSCREWADDLRRQLGVEEEGGDGRDGDARGALPATPEAARFYAEGLERLHLFDAVGARDLLTRAVAAEPGNALSHSALATAWSALGYDAKARDEAKAAFDLSATCRARSACWSRPATARSSRTGTAPSRPGGSCGSSSPTISTTACVSPPCKRPPAGWRTPSPPPELYGLSPRRPGAIPASTWPRPWRRVPAPTSNASRRRRSALRPAGRFEVRRSWWLKAVSCSAARWRNLGQGDAALAACEAGRKLHEQAGDRAGVAEALTHAANVLFDRGDLPGAGKLYEQALATYREIGNRGAEAGALKQYRRGAEKPGRPGARPASSTSRCWRSAARSAAAAARPTPLNNLAGVLLRRGELDAAAKLFDQSLAIRREQQDRSGIAYALDNLGVVLRPQRRPRRCAQAARGGPRHAARDRAVRSGEVDLAQQSRRRAPGSGGADGGPEQFEAALRLARQTGNKSATAYSLFGLGEVLAPRGQRRRGQEAARGGPRPAHPARREGHLRREPAGAGGESCWIQATRHARPISPCRRRRDEAGRERRAIRPAPWPSPP